MPIEQLISGEPEDPLPMSPAWGTTSTTHFSTEFRRHYPVTEPVGPIFERVSRGLNASIGNVTTMVKGYYTPGCLFRFSDAGNAVLKKIKQRRRERRKQALATVRLVN